MIDNIKNFGSSDLLKIQDGAKRDFGMKSKTSNTSTVPETAVHLSQDALKLAVTKKSILLAPDIDEAKVEKIKDMISRGEYKISYENLANRMMSGFARSC